MLTPSSSWTSKSQDSFKAYMGKILGAWQDGIAAMLEQLFDGSETSVKVLTHTISQGKVIAGGYPNAPGDQPPTQPGDADAKTMKDAFVHSFYGYMVPALWRASGKNAFVMDTGYGCDGGNLDQVFLPKDARTACYKGKLYALAYPDEQLSVQDHFLNPPGLKHLDGNQDNWGGVTPEEIILG